jgi:low affinity Fe/Cu permease
MNKQSDRRFSANSESLGGDDSSAGARAGVPAGTQAGTDAVDQASTRAGALAAIRRDNEPGGQSSVDPGPPAHARSPGHAKRAAEADPSAPETRWHKFLCAFDSFASLVTRWAGSPIAFGLAVASLVLWVVTGPLFKYSDGWQLVINTGTTIITFLMVFLIQQSQNKDSAAVHLKLDELISSSKSASNRLVGIQDATEDELRKLADYYTSLAERAAAGQDERERGR